MNGCSKHFLKNQVFAQRERNYPTVEVKLLFWGQKKINIPHKRVHSYHEIASTFTDGLFMSEHPEDPRADYSRSSLVAGWVSHLASPQECRVETSGSWEAACPPSPPWIPPTPPRCPSLPRICSYHLRSARPSLTCAAPSASLWPLTCSSSPFCGSLSWM